MVRLRLTRLGAKKRPFYRIVAADRRMKRDGRHIENIGVFDPAGPFQIDRTRLDYWTDKGALPSATLARLLKANPAVAAEAKS